MTTAAMVPDVVAFRKSENAAGVRCAAACHFSASPPEIAKTTRRTPAAIQNIRVRGNLPARTDTSTGDEMDQPWLDCARRRSVERCRTKEGPVLWESAAERRNPSPARY